MSTIPYRLAEPHTTIRYCFTASCSISLLLLQRGPQHQEFAEHGGVPCLGSFRPGLWCEGCRFGQVSLIEAQDTP